MKRSFLCTLLLVSLCTPFNAQSSQWQKYRNTGGNFTVLMPVQPQETANAASEGQSSRTIQAMDNGMGYMVVYVAIEAEQPVNEPTFKVYRDSFMKGLPTCVMDREEAPSPALQGYVGHWYRMNCDIKGTKITFTGNLYWGKHYAYAVLAMFPSQSSAPATAAKFTNSFSLIDNNK